MEGFAIFAAVNGALTAINTTKGWMTELRTFVRESRGAGETIQRFLVEYAAFEGELERWAKMWGVNSEVSQTYLIKLWGRSGSRSIEHYLGIILKSGEDVKKILDSCHKESTTSSPPPATGSPFMDRSRLAAEAQEKMKQTQKALTMQKLLGFVMSKSPELLRRTASIRNDVAAMKVVANSAYFDKNQVAISGDTLPRAKLRETQVELLLELAYETRLASKGLYRSCYAASQIRSAVDGIESIKLEMDLIRKELTSPETVVARDNIPLIYQFLVTWSRKIVELCVEGPFNLDENSVARETIRQEQDGFYRACVNYKAQINEAENFQVIDCGSKKWFRAKVPPLPTRLIDQSRSSQQLKPLSDLLYELRVKIKDEPTEKFRRSERIRLAFKIVECGLFLSGTSWLAGLKSQNVQRSPRLTDSRRFVFETQATKKDFDDDDFRNFAPQAFDIGALLVEIGTGRQIEKVLPWSKALGQGLSLYKAGSNPPSEPEAFHAPAIFKLLSIAMGDEYAKSAQVCLASKKSWKQAIRQAQSRAEVYQKILSDYYLDVYLPLKSLHEKI